MANNRGSTPMQTYREAEQFLLKGRNKDERPLTGRSTVVRRIDEHTIAVRYHATDVVTYHDDHRVTLDSGGYFTMTTKERMHTYSPISIGQSNGLWYVWSTADQRAGGELFWGNLKGGALPMFFDGIESDEDGMLLNARPVSDQLKTEAAKRTVDRLVSRFIKGYEQQARDAGALFKPSTGDCWYCALQDQASGRTFGDVSGDVTHLLDHLQESYFVPSLLYNAINERRFGGGVGMIWSMLDGDIARGRSDLFHLRNSLRQYFHSRKVRLAELLAHQEEVAA